MNSILKLKPWVNSLFLLLLLFIPQIVWADNLQTEVSATTEALPVMPDIHVEALRVAPTTGMTIIDKEMIENLPARNGSVNEIIGIAPGVQYSEASLSSFTGGEITPPTVSISGSRFYDNNFTIDGISNNNSLDPALNSSSNTYKLPGSPQLHFFSPEIIEQVTVYSSNIPAEFGGFTGGLIDTQTIDPTADFWGKIHYRTTSDSWTKFHIDPLDNEDFYNSNYPDMQPEFRKDDFGFTLNTPLGIDTSLVTSYQQLYAEIPLRHLEEFKPQIRKHEIFFFKLKHYLTNNFNVSLTAFYSPTSAQYFSRNFKESDYSIETDNYSLLAQAEKNFNRNQLKLTLGYSSQKISRTAPENRFLWSPDTNSIDWPGGGMGGSGDLETGQDKLHIKSELLFAGLNLGQTNHIFKLGGEATYSKQYYYRPKTSYYYYRYRINALTSCLPGDIACVENEQYLYKRTKYTQTDTDVEITNLAAFIQDSIIWKRLELVPGVRVSYNDFTRNVNIAPRFAASLDIFGNQMTTLFTGINRYYSGTLLTYALYEDIKIIKQERSDNLSDWEDVASRPVPFHFKAGEVDTPYSDELTLGIIQKVLGGELKFQYIEKKNKDELARSRIVDPAHVEPDIYLFNNFGRSEHKSYQLSWQRSWVNHFLEINVTWQETTTSNDDYVEILDEEDTAETIWYAGKELHYYEIPRTDFNRPVVANLIYTCNLPYNITVTNTTKYRGAYWRLWNTRERQASVTNPAQSPEPYIYKKVENHSTVIFDWRFRWETTKRFKQNIALTVDIFNVFNHKAKTGYQSGDYGYDYELGRQIWAGLEFNF